MNRMIDEKIAVSKVVPTAANTADVTVYAVTAVSISLNA